jgi:hypothetical protein
MVYGTLLGVLLSLLVVSNILNVFGGVVSGIWLAILGKWRILGVGLLMAVLMPMAYAVLSLPSMGLGLVVANLGKRCSTVLCAIVAFPASLYSLAIVGCWVFFVFGYFIQQSAPGSHIPMILWSYSVSMAPLGFMASKEDSDNPGPVFAALLAQVSYLLLLVLWALDVSKVAQVISLSTVVVLWSVGRHVVGFRILARQHAAHDELGIPSSNEP